MDGAVRGSSSRGPFFAAACGLSATTLGGLVLAGWWVDLPALRTPFGFGAAMRANAAAAFIACGLGIALLARERPPRVLRAIVAAAGAAVVLLAALTLAQDIAGVDFGIDQALVRDRHTTGLDMPGRMSPPTAFSLVLCGLALVLLATARPDVIPGPTVPALGATVVVVGGIAVAGHLLRATIDLQFLNYSRIAITSATSLLLLGTGFVLLACRVRPLRWSLDRRSSAGFVAGLVAMVAGAGVAYEYTVAMRDDAAEVQRALQRLRVIQRLNALLGDFTLSTGRYIITRDEAALADRGSLQRGIADTLARLRALGLDPEFHERLERIDDLQGRRIALSEEIIGRFRALVRAGRLPGPADPPILGREYPALGVEIDRLVDQLETDGYADLGRRQTRADKATSRAFLLLPLGTLVGMALLVAGLFHLNAAEAARRRGDGALRRSATRLEMLHAIDLAIIAARPPAEIAVAALQRLRDLLDLPRVAVNLISADRREATWLASAGRRRDYIGPGVRFPAEFLGDVDALARGEAQVVETGRFAGRPEADGLLAADVRWYRVLPMVVGERLIGGLAFGGPDREIDGENLQIAREVAAQLAIALHQAALREDASVADERFRAMFESSPVGISITTFEGRVLSVNPALFHMLGYDSKEQMFEAMLMQAHEVYVDPRARDEYVARVRGGGATLGFETRLRRADGRILWVSLTGSEIASRPGEPPLIVTMAVDVTLRREQEHHIARLSRVKEMHAQVNSAVVRATGRQALLDEVCRVAVDAGGLSAAWVVWHDAAARRLLPAAQAGNVDGFLRGLLHRTDIEPPPGNLSLQVFREGVPRAVQDIRAMPELMVREAAVSRGYLSTMHLPLKVGGRTEGVLVLCAGEPQAFDDEEQRLLDGLAADVSFALDSIEKTERLDYLAFYDPVTGLPNRRLFENRLKQSLHTRGGDALIALAVINVERFARINDTLGRSAGDQLLAQIGQRLAQAHDGVARLGGDVFALVLRGAREPAQVMRQLEDLLTDALAAGFEANGSSLRLSCRAGVAVYPADGGDEHALLRNAEVAVRRAKETGDPIVFYAPDMNARVAEALSLESRLRQALARGEFVLHYQPKIHLLSGAVTGLEALLRWQPEGEPLVAPGKFIPVLEETGMIVEVGRWAVAQAGRDQAAWAAGGLVAPRVAVNVSAIQLQRRSFVDEMIDAIAGGGDRPEALELEITESLAMRDVEQTIRKLGILRGMGVRVAIDDFGTGYSSLSYLSRLPVDVLKIDRSFVSGVARGGAAGALVASIIALAHGLRLKVVAEGVESVAQAAALRRLACDEAQGYLYSPPVPAADITAFLRAHDGVTG